MNTTETKALATQLEVNLDLDLENEKLLATPARNITVELRDGIRQNKDEIMRDLLIKQAYEIIAVNNPRERDVSEVYPEGFDAVNAAYGQVEFGEFRKVLRQWTVAVIRSLTKEGAA